MAGTTSRALSGVAISSSPAATGAGELRGLQRLQRGAQLFMRRSQVLRQLHLAVEVDDKGFVLFFPQHLRQKALTGIALFVEDASLAHAGIDQHAERQREVGFAGEIFEASAGARPR